MRLSDLMPRGVDGIQDWPGLKISVEQQELTAGLRYVAFVGNQPGFRAVANRALLPVRRHLAVTDVQSRRVAGLRQMNLLRRWVEYLRVPIYCPYRIEIGGEDVGWIGRRFLPGQLCATGVCRGEKYRILNHNWNLYSVWRGGWQTGLIQRQAERTWNADKYVGQFDANSEPLLAVLLALFCDLAWHSNKPVLSPVDYNWVGTWSGGSVDWNWRPKTGASAGREESAGR